MLVGLEVKGREGASHQLVLELGLSGDMCNVSPRFNDENKTHGHSRPQWRRQVLSRGGASQVIQVSVLTSSLFSEGGEFRSPPEMGSAAKGLCVKVWLPASDTNEK